MGSVIALNVGFLAFSIPVALLIDGSVYFYVGYSYSMFAKRSFSIKWEPI